MLWISLWLILQGCSGEPRPPATPAPTRFNWVPDQTFNAARTLAVAPGRLGRVIIGAWDGPAPSDEAYVHDGQLDVPTSGLLSHPEYLAYFHDLWFPGDVDGDGVEDLAAGGWLAPLDGEFHLLGPEFGPRLEGEFPGLPCGDVSGDGLVDLCLGGRVYLGPVGPERTVALSWDITPDAPSAAVDHDQDGLASIFVAAAGGVVRIDGRMSGHLDLGTLPLWAHPDPILALEGGDFDGDGASELVVLTEYDLLVVDASGLHTVRRLGDGAPRMRGREPSGGLAVGDLTGDGEAEVAIRWGERLRIVDWEGRLLAHWFDERLMNMYGGLRTHAIEDLDLDGQLDFVLILSEADFPSGEVALFLGPLEFSL